MKNKTQISIKYFYFRKMVSRRKILNRSRDGLNIDLDEDDIWYQKEKLFKVSCCFIMCIEANFRN